MRKSTRLVLAGLFSVLGLTLVSPVSPAAIAITPGHTHCCIG